MGVVGSRTSWKYSVAMSYMRGTVTAMDFVKLDEG